MPSNFTTYIKQPDRGNLGPPGVILHRCSFCERSHSQLLRCLGCKGVRYCDRLHQAADWPNHKGPCNLLKKLQQAFDRETVRMDASQKLGGDDFIIFDVDWVQARMDLASNMFLLSTLDGLNEAYKHLKILVRHCHTIKTGQEELFPAIALRLDRDQECYDFVKWWELRIFFKDADALEDPSWLINGGSFTNLFAVLILKVKLLVDIINLQIIRKVLAAHPLPTDLHEQMELSVIRSPLSTQFRKLPHRDLILTELELQNQIRRLGEAALDRKRVFLKNLFEFNEKVYVPDTKPIDMHKDSPPLFYKFWAVLWETEGILPLLREARECVARDWRNTSGWVVFASTPETRDMTLKNSSLNDMWMRIRDAAWSASYLGPPENRPSECEYHRRVESGWCIDPDEAKYHHIRYGH